MEKGTEDDQYANGSDIKAALLEGKRQLTGNGQRSSKLSRRNSVNSLRREFFSRLPDKVRSCVDPESFPVVNLSNAPLTKGFPSLFLLFFVSSFLLSVVCFGLHVGEIVRQCLCLNFEP